MAYTDKEQVGVGAGAEMVPLRFLVPRAWRDGLAEAAKVQGVSMADLCRIVLGRFLRNRYTAEQQSALASGTGGES